jgi:hypothetical protein
MDICVNRLFEWLTDEVPEVYRILWIAPSCTEMVIIKLWVEKLETPVLQYTDFEKALDAHEIRLLERDPYASYMRPDDTLSEKSCKRRDEAWELIKPLAIDGSPRIFDAVERGSMVRDVVERTHKSKTTIYTYLRRYWQHGQTVNALVLDFQKQGGAGKRRQAKSGAPKRGRPNKNGERTGVNITDEIRDYFQDGIDLLKKGIVKTQKKAFDKVLEKYFKLGYEFRDGVPVPILPPWEELPSLKQFRDFYREEVDPVEMTKAIIGDNRFNLRHRSMKGDSTVMAFGPGSIFQFDSTPFDVSLISLLDPSLIVNRATLYLGADVFSHLIVALSISFENASWAGFKVAFENAATDKVLFCQQHGIHITEEQWPCRHLSETILADRGEVNNRNTRHLTKALGTHFSLTAPYRADMKGIIEQLFDWMNGEIGDDLPGKVPKEFGRGDRDYRLNARVNIQELRKLLIRAALYYNQYHYIREYPSDQFMLNDRVKKIPIELWKWGICNRNGILKRVDPDVLHLNLLPREQASITPDGIYFKGIYYICDLPEIRQKIDRIAISKRREKVWVSYNPHGQIDEIYLHLGKGQIVSCNRTDNPKTQKFQGFYFEEVENYRTAEQQEAKNQEARQRQGRAELSAHRDAIVKPATKRTEQAIKDSGLSKHARLTDTRENKQADRDLERAQAYQPNIERVSNTAKEEAVSPQSKQSEPAEKGYVAPPSYTALLRQLDEEDEPGE